MFSKLGNNYSSLGRSSASGSLNTNTVKWVAEGDSITLGLGGTPAYPFASLSTMSGVASTPGTNTPTSAPVPGVGTVNLSDIATSGISALTISQNYATRGGAAFDATKHLNLFSIMAGTNTSGGTDTTALQKYVLLRNILRQARFTGYQRRVIGTTTARDDDGGTTWTNILVPLNSNIRTYYNSDMDADGLMDFGNDPNFSPASAADNLTYYISDKLHPNVFGEGPSGMGADSEPVVLAALKAAGTRVLPPMTWSIFDNGGTNRILSNGNRTLTNSSGSNGGGSTYGFPVITGKRYWEVAVNIVTASMQIGLGNEDVEQSTGSFDIFNNVNSLSYGNTGTVQINSVTLATASAYTTNDIVSFAMDNDAKLLWVKKITAGVSSTWNGSGAANPATGVGGIDISSMYHANFGGGFIHPAMCPRNNTAQATSNFAAAQLSGTIPTGFLALDQ